MPRHDADAGGPAALLERKAALRERVWDALDAPGVRRFPGAGGRIPNFVGAEAAAARLAETQPWRAARVLKANPDAPQLPVRARALAEGRCVVMAVPRLAGSKPFLLLEPERLSVSARRAASIGGATRAGRLVDVGALEPFDLVVCGCVAVDETGARLGKGGGFSDLEYALASEAGLIGPRTRVVTTVHERQVLPPGEIPMATHDFRLDLVVTPDRVIRCERKRRSRGRIRWDDLTSEKIAAIPLLARLARRRR
jgi:5-formyltetrahydrofolate cyclo-ligase